MRKHDEQKAVEKITLIGAFLDLCLGVLKITTGLFSSSHALVVDGIHSLSDLFTDAIVFVVLRMSNKAPDDDHPYGHGRFETVATVFLGSTLIAVGLAIGYESIKAFITHFDAPNIPTWPALIVAALSIVVKEAIFQYTLRVGQRVKSDMIIANAWHSRTDALSSVVVLVGVGGAMLGLWWLDAVAAVLVAGLIAKVGWDMTWDNIKELVDTGLAPETIAAFEQTVSSVAGVEGVHSVKSRHMANKLLLELHIQVDPHCSASEGHFIGNQCTIALKAKHEELGHIVFHIDTYDDGDEETHLLMHGLSAKGADPLATRDALEQLIQEHLVAYQSTGGHWQLQLYYDHKVDVSLMFEQGYPSAEELDALKASLSDKTWFGRLTTWQAAN